MTSVHSPLRETVSEADRAGYLSLASLPAFGQKRMWIAFERATPLDDLAGFARGKFPAEYRAGQRQQAAWQPAARNLIPSEVYAEHRDAGVAVWAFGDDGYPTLDIRDEHIGPTLLARGRGVAPTYVPRSRPSVGIVGTRRASRYGLDVAREFARELTAMGACVVSGLASGIDAAAHRGALEAANVPPVAVVGSGLDVVYPRSNTQLWADVAASGVVLSEYVLGTPPMAWQFPARNRVLASLCDVLVVIESHERGGSLLTAGAAGERGVPVMAVPGSIRSAASLGSNRLLADGCIPCLGIDDITTVLSLVGAPIGPGQGVLDLGSASTPAVTLSEVERLVLDAMGWGPTSVDALARDLPDLGIGAIALAIARLEQIRIVESGAGYIERIGSA